MSRRARLFDTAADARPRLDASRLTRGPFAWLTPNRVVTICRAILAVLLLVVLIAGPDGQGSIALRFLVAYGMTVVAMPAFARISERHIGGAVALLLGMRWAFSTLDGGTADMLLTQLLGVACAVVPVYARNVGGLAGSSEGHISFTDRRTMWRHHATRRPRPPASATPQPPSQPTPASAAPAPASTIALLDYRPENEG